VARNRQRRRGRRDNHAGVTGKPKSPRSGQIRPKQKSRWARVQSGLVTWTGALITSAAVAAVAAVVTVVVTGAVTRQVAAAPIAAGRHGPPVKIDSVTVLRTVAQAGTYVFQRPLDLSQSELRSLNQLQDLTPQYYAWFRSRGGVDPSTSNVQLVLEGNAAQAVRITNMVLVKQCTAPLSGTLFASPSAGNEHSILINFDLDSPQPVAQTPGGHDFFTANTISLQPGEVQVIQITASTKLFYCQYSIHLTALTGDHATEETITDNGQPFRVTATYTSVARYHALYVGGVATRTGYFMRENPQAYASGA
jgi:hypothetical protein